MENQANKSTPGFAISDEWLDDVFSHHPPTDSMTIQAYRNIREAGKHLARVIATHSPRCADQTAAIRKVREAVMTANAAVALEGRV